MSEFGGVTTPEASNEEVQPVEVVPEEVVEDIKEQLPEPEPMVLPDPKPRFAKCPQCGYSGYSTQMIGKKAICKHNCSREVVFVAVY